MYYDLRPPLPRSHHHELFQQASAHKDESLLRRCSLGAQIEDVQSRLGFLASREDADAVVETYETEYREDLAGYVAQQIDALKGPLSPNSSRRQNPRLYLDLLDQIVLLPPLFSYSILNKRARAHRERLIGREGMYGTIASALENTLTSGALPTDPYLPPKRRIGYINELTALGLLNRNQFPDAAAIPALPEEDEKQKQDITYICYANEDSNRCAIYRHPQVKSYERHFRPNADTPSRLLIGGIALGNSFFDNPWRKTGSCQTAEAIVREVNGIASYFEIKILDKITSALTESVEKNESFITSHLLASVAHAPLVV